MVLLIFLSLFSGRNFVLYKFHRVEIFSLIYFTFIQNISQGNPAVVSAQTECLKYGNTNLISINPKALKIKPNLSQLLVLLLPIDNMSLLLWRVGLLNNCYHSGR